MQAVWRVVFEGKSIREYVDVHLLENVTTNPARASIVRSELRTSPAFFCRRLRRRETNRPPALLLISHHPRLGGVVTAVCMEELLDRLRARLAMRVHRD